MLSASPGSGLRLLGPIVCFVVVLIMIIAGAYTLWIGVDDYSSIGV